MQRNVFAAIKSHDPERLKVALDRGADPDERSFEPPWRVPLQEAVNELENGGPLEALCLLLERGANLEKRDGTEDTTPLLMAVMRGEQKAVELLLQAGADPNVISAEGDTPLRWCIAHRDLKMATTLLANGAGKIIDNAGGASGLSALGLAVKLLDYEAVQLLLEAGANPLARDADGQTALQVLSRAPEQKTQLHAAITALLTGVQE